MGDLVRTRFAPSPSGHLHVGGARTALFCWAYARKHDGRLVLRIEDTDRKRSSETATAAFMEDLEWLGIAWDEGPFYQSQRLEQYHHAIDQLIANGAAYRAFETPEELAAARKKAGAGYRYDRAALQLDAATVDSYVAQSRPHVVRFKLPDVAEVAFHDEVRGDVSVAIAELDDLVILKADGYPTYHFAVVVDDQQMEVTHVIRGQEHLHNTARHVLLQEALGYRRPAYAHLSLIFNPNGSKMSKRERDKVLRRAVKDGGVAGPPENTVSRDEWSRWLADDDLQLEIEPAGRLAAALDVRLPEIDVEDFRRAGYLPEVMVNYLALLGWSPGGDREKFDAAFLVEHFDLDRVIKSPAKFDREKLLAFNLDALQAMADDEFETRLRAHAARYHPGFLETLGDDRVAIFAAVNRERSKTLDDPFRDGRFFVVPDDEIVYQRSKAVRKALGSGDPNGCAHLEALVPILEQLPAWETADLEAAVTRYADDHADGKLGKVAQPIRVAVSGGPVSPAIFDTLYILGRERTLNRIARCLGSRDTLLATT